MAVHCPETRLVPAVLEAVDALKQSLRCLGPGWINNFRREANKIVEVDGVATNENDEGNDEGEEFETVEDKTADDAVQKERFDRDGMKKRSKDSPSLCIEQRHTDAKRTKERN